MALNVPRLHGPNDDSKADRGFIGEGGKNMNRKDWVSFRFGRLGDLGFVSRGTFVSHPSRKNKYAARAGHPCAC
jgi:hypothetical protein